MSKRDTHRYHYISKGKIAHRGVTNDLGRREQEHRQTYGGGWIKQIGPKVTRNSALKWERDGGKRI